MNNITKYNQRVVGIRIGYEKIITYTAIENTLNPTDHQGNPTEVVHNPVRPWSVSDHVSLNLRTKLNYTKLVNLIT